MFKRSIGSALYCILLFTFIANIFTPAAFAQFSRSTSARMLVSNDFGPENPSAIGVGPGSVVDDPNGGTVSVGDNIGYTGMDREGMLQTLFFSGNASSTAEFGRLRASTQGNITNAFYNSDNIPYFDQANGNQVNEDGVPDYFAIESEASFSDTLQYGGTAVGYTSRYLLNLTGNVGGNDAFIYYQITHGASTFSAPVSSVNGQYNISINSTSFVTSPNQTFSIRLLTSFQSHSEFVTDGENVFGSADFGNTLELVGIDVRDQNGNLIPQGSVMGASGTSYSIQSAVPEPTSFAFLSVGCMLLGLGRRRVG